MRVVIQRVSSGSVIVDGKEHAHIARGYVILLGIKHGDTAADALFLADKCTGLRVFEDTQGKMNLDLRDVGGGVLVVSQFTLYADAQKGNRPGFSRAAPADEAKPLYEQFVARMRMNLGEERVRTGVFGAMMQVHIVNDGPVTIVIESPSGPTNPLTETDPRKVLGRSA
jgi:D-aminoacyl-tRNA deacylase